MLAADDGTGVVKLKDIAKFSTSINGLHLYLTEVDPISE